MTNRHTLGLSTLLLLSVLSSFGCATRTPVDSGPIFYPAPPQRPRIQFLTSISGAQDIEEPASALMTFLVGDLSKNRRFRKPTSISAHAGVIYVADPGWDTVFVLDLNEHTFDSIRDRGMGKLQVPVAVTVDASGNKFVADSGRNQVLQFNERNEFVQTYGNPETLRPTGVAVSDEFLYVVNRNKHQIEIYDRHSRERVREFGEFGGGEGQFNIPTSLTRRDDGHLFVTDSANFRIQEFDAQGEFLRSFGFLGDGPGTFARPRGIAVDRDGHLYVTDAAFENVQIWDTDSAQVLLAFGGPGIAPGTMYLPASVHIDYELVDYFREFVDSDFELIYVALVVNNYGPHKISIYGFVNPKDPSKYPEYALPIENSSP